MMWGKNRKRHGNYVLPLLYYVFSARKHVYFDEINY